MDASFLGVCDDEAIHSPAIIICTTIARTQIALKVEGVKVFA